MVDEVFVPAKGATVRVTDRTVTGLDTGVLASIVPVVRPGTKESSVSASVSATLNSHAPVDEFRLPDGPKSPKFVNDVGRSSRSDAPAPRLRQLVRRRQSRPADQEVVV